MTTFGEIKPVWTLGANVSVQSGIDRTPVIYKGSLVKTINSNTVSIYPSEINSSITNGQASTLMVCNGHYEACACYYSVPRWNNTNGCWYISLHDRSTGNLYTTNGSLRINYAWFGSVNDYDPTIGNQRLNANFGSQIVYSSNTLTTTPTIYKATKNWCAANTNYEVQVYASNFGLSGSLNPTDFVAVTDYSGDSASSDNSLVTPTACYYNGYYFLPQHDWNSTASTSNVTHTYGLLLIR